MCECIGKICSFCKNEIKERDNTVVCSDCGETYHENCWVQNKGCATSDCYGTVKINSSNNYIQNNHYGTEPNQDLKIISQNYEEDVYIQCLLEYYKPRFSEMRPLNKKVTWNWSSYFGVSFWLVYRKMYAWAAGVFAVQFLLKLIAVRYMYVLTWVISIAMGMIGNYIYKQRIDRLIIEGRNLPESMKAKHIQKNGGVNVTATVLCVVTYSVYVIINVILIML